MITKATKEGLHVRCANKCIDGFVVYELWSGDAFVCSAHGPCAVMTLALTAEYLSVPEDCRRFIDSMSWLFPLARNDERSGTTDIQGGFQ